VVADECSLRCGDQVIVYPWRGCQQCEVCDSGDSNMCENNKSATTDIGQGQYGGGFGEIVVVPEHKLAVKVPVSIPPHIACMLPCSAGVAYRAIVNARPVLDAAIRTRGVANLLVIGCGGLGQWVVILVKAILCNPNIKVVCADLNKKKLESVEKLGADDVIEWSAQKTINDLVSATTVSGYNKIDAAIDLVANPYTVEIAFRSLHNGGTIVCIGLAGGEFPISLPMLITKNISIQGLRVLGLRQFKEFVDLFGVQNGNVYPAVTYFSLDGINDAIEKLRKGEISGRAIIKYI
jgi:propanol-preferring alcohol dehydrogenase